MSIQSDRWIREQALKGMIEPFSDSLVREGVISYGISSFGYDLRAAPDWRIFVNAFNTLVDPKHFDTDSLVEAHGDTCIIPPNSFALTRSVEYMRIPDDVMVVALGKSSYARCFRGDTRVALANGAAPTLEQMAHRHLEGERFFGYSMGPHGRLMVTLLDAPRHVGRDDVVEVRLDNGESIHCTPDHRFLTRDGRMVAACDLTPDTSLMPLYRSVERGCEMVYLPLSGNFQSTRRLLDEWKTRSRIHRGRAATRRARLDHGRLDRGRIMPRRFPEVIEAFKGQAPARRLNHKVVSVRSLKSEEEVFCLTVPEAGNFAVESGVFVQNCGIVANVTPLEPGWEGHVTLELSNTTPLPAKVYANEGIVQLLFFKGERPEVTYADRKGKYQGQRGVTLPKL
jgi:deoxycytidine triphosphate deaminase